jgi:hypothetical protein
MSAVAIMDPTMDAGMFQALAPTKAQIAELSSIPVSHSQLVAIADRLIALVAMFSSGIPIHQSVVTFLPTQAVDAIDHPLLRLLVIAALKIADVVRGVVVAGDTWQEEDFVSVATGVDFRSELTDDAVICLLNEEVNSTHARSPYAPQENSLTQATARLSRAPG